MNVEDTTKHYYGEQLRRYITQFAQVFSGMHVKTGKNDLSSNQYIRVPIVYGSPDKVVSAIIAENTQNKLIRVPMFSMKLDGINIALDRKVGTNTESRQTVFPSGGDIKKDLKVLRRPKPIPYNLNISVAAFTRNTDQMFQLMEQILMLFDPTLQFQRSDKNFDWTKIVDAELNSVDIDDNRSGDNDGRILMITFGFEVRIHLAPPATLKDDVIKSIRLRIDALDGAENTAETALDVDRDEPQYITIYDLDEENIPSN